MSLGTVGKPKVNLGSTGARTFASSKKANVYTLDRIPNFKDYIMREFGILKQKVALDGAEADTLGKDTIKTQVANHFKVIEDQIKEALPFFTKTLNRFISKGYPEDESFNHAYAAIKSMVKDAVSAAEMTHPLKGFESKMHNATLTI